MDKEQLENLKRTVEQHARLLTQAETQQERAKQEEGELEARIKEHGLDPAKPLGPQIDARERELLALAADLNQVAEHVQARLS